MDAAARSLTAFVLGFAAAFGVACAQAGPTPNASGQSIDLAGDAGESGMLAIDFPGAPSNAEVNVTVPGASVFATSFPARVRVPLGRVAVTAHDPTLGFFSNLVTLNGERRIAEVVVRLSQEGSRYNYGLLPADVVDTTGLVRAWVFDEGQPADPLFETASVHGNEKGAGYIQRKVVIDVVGDVWRAHGLLNDTIRFFKVASIEPPTLREIRALAEQGVQGGLAIVQKCDEPHYLGGGGMITSYIDRPVGQELVILASAAGRDCLTRPAGTSRAIAAWVASVAERAPQLPPFVPPPTPPVQPEASVKKPWKSKCGCAEKDLACNMGCAAR